MSLQKVMPRQAMASVQRPVVSKNQAVAMLQKSYQLFSLLADFLQGHQSYLEALIILFCNSNDRLLPCVRAKVNQVIYKLNTS